MGENYFGLANLDTMSYPIISHNILENFLFDSTKHRNEIVVFQTVIVKSNPMALGRLQANFADNKDAWKDTYEIILHYQELYERNKKLILKHEFQTIKKIYERFGFKLSK